MLNDVHMVNVLPNITMLFECTDDARANYCNIARAALAHILPPNLLVPASDDPDRLIDQKEEFAALLPIFYVSPINAGIPTNISLFSLSKYRQNAFQFFFEMTSHWLVPGKRLNVVLVNAVDFHMPNLGDDLYTLCEVIVRIEEQQDFEKLQSNLPIIETEIRLGMQSGYYARRILEIRGLSTDAKTGIIQNYIASLITRLPKMFDHDLIIEMQHVLVMCRDEFKAERESRHLSKIISGHYLFRKALRQMTEHASEKRHLNLKIFRASISRRDAKQDVLGILVGFNFLRDKEVFEERHLLSAIHNYVPSAEAVSHSFFANRRGSEHICTFYIEIQKSDEESFSSDEIKMLRHELPIDLKDRIEHLMHPVFMPRNEEEIMRNILSLSNQIKYLHDLPQVIISFDQQTHIDLFFTIILVRVMKPGCASVQEMFIAVNSTVDYIHDRSKTVGFLRKKYAKEASVFRLKLPKYQFLRRDHSIDLNKARQAIANELYKVFGEIRDFNGGLISKQNESLCLLRESLENSVKYNDLLLENFFYSLTPDVMRTILEPAMLQAWFLLLAESIEASFFAGEDYAIKIQFENNCVIAMVKTENKGLRELLNNALSAFDPASTKLACSYVSVYELSYIGFLYLCTDTDGQQAFYQTIQNTLADWKRHA